MFSWSKSVRSPGWLAVLVAGCLWSLLFFAGGRAVADDAAPVPKSAGAMRRPSMRLSLDPARAGMVGQFLSDTNGQEVRFDALLTGRYVCLETLSAHDGRPYTALAEFHLFDELGNDLDRSGWSIAYADSEELSREDGSAENAIDGKETTFWHTEWNNAAPNHPHHLVLDLGRSQRISGFRYVPRPGIGIQGGRIKDYRIYVGDDLVEESAIDAGLPQDFFLLAYFTGNGEGGLHLAYSLKGYRWDVLARGRSVLKPEAGEVKLMRDPCLRQGPDGTYHLVWTSSWAGNEIGYASSRDLIHWSRQRVLPVMVDWPGTVNCWAPELFWDERRQQFLIFWTSTVSPGAKDVKTDKTPKADSNRIYCRTTRDFVSFSPTRLMFDPGRAVLDASMIQAVGRFHLLFKDDVPSRLNMATAADPEGPYGSPGQPFGPFRLEGPTVFQNGGQHVICYRTSRENRCGAIKSADFAHWEDISSGVSLPVDAMQGSVLRLPGTVLGALRDAGWLDIGNSPAASELGIGDWIWAPVVTDKQTCRFWRDFDIPRDSQVIRAELKMTVDNSYTVFLDGREIGRGSDVNCLTEYDLTLLLGPGHHVLTVEAFNETMDAGLILGMRIKLSDGRKILLMSDPSWRIAAADSRNWQTRKQAEPSWQPAQTVGYAGKAWWQFPFKMIQAPPLQPFASHFWQQSWFLILLLALCLAGLVLCVRLGLSLALHTRAHRLLVRERARIARDIHDDLGAGLTQLTLLGELALHETPPDAPASNRLKELCGRARVLLKSMDEIVWTVNSRRDTVQDLAAFLSEHVQEYLNTTSIRCRLEVAEELPAITLDLPRRRNLMLAVKEAIRNAVRHSDASELTLRVRVSGQNLEVVVEDNGRGFQQKTAHTVRNGLSNMKQRLLDIGGTCSVSASLGAGCRVVFSLPLLDPKLHKGWLSRLAKPSGSHSDLGGPMP